MSLPRTPSQTVGPYFAIALPWPEGPLVVAEGTPGGIWIRGRVLDGAGEPVEDALVETWQADTAGRFPRPDAADGQQTGFRGFGRSATDDEGNWAIHTLRPGAVTVGDGARQAPHLSVLVFARGLLRPVASRIYFEDEEAANAADPLLATVDEPERRATLLARRTEDGYRFDIHLQGADETVFLDV